MNARKTNLVVLVGAGSGDPQLLTLEGARWLGRAEVVVYDRLIPTALLELAPAGAQRIYVGKGPAGHVMTQEQINALLVELGLAGKMVVRLKGGDPFVFGRGGEEAAALREAGIDFRIVPGVTAAIAGGAYAGIPVTDRRCASSVALVTGHEDPAKEMSSLNWAALAGIDTVVFYMGVGNLPNIARSLMAAGRAGETPCAVIAQATTPRQRTLTATLATVAEAVAAAGIEPPAITIVGEVVALREQLAWFDRLPLFGQTVLVTRTRQQASGLSAVLRQAGAEVIEAPTIAIEPAADLGALDEAIGDLRRFDWLVLTSPNGAERFFDRLGALGGDARSLAGVQIAAVGPATAEALRQRSIEPDLIPEEFTTRSLAEAMTAAGVAGRRVLLARADIATAELREALVAAKAQVHEVELYRTVAVESLPAEAMAALQAGEVGWITFTSSSTVENFLALAAKAGTSLAGVKLAAIGPVTAQTLQSHGLTATVTASPHTVEALAEAMIQFGRG